MRKVNSPAQSQLDRPSDGSVDVRNDHFIVPVPQIDGAFTATGALILGGDAEDDVIGAILQLQAFLKNTACPPEGAAQTELVS